MNKASLAIVGFGQIGGKHAGAIEAADGCKLAAICDPSAAARERAAQLGVPCFETPGELLARARPDGVIVATHTQAHVTAASECVEAGIPCLVEKPFAVTAADARELLALARARGVPLLTGHHRRHNALVQRAHELVQDGTLGRLVGVNALWALRKHDTYYDVPWRTQPGAGPILTNLIHDVDSLRYICGEIGQVAAMTSSAVRGHAVEDTASVSLTFESGALGSILITDAGNSPWAWEVNSEENPDYPVMTQNSVFFTGTEAALAFPRLEIWRHTEAGEPHWFKPMAGERIEVPYRDPLVVQAEHFARVIAGTEAPRVSGAEGSRTLACIEAIFEAARSGETVTPDFTGL